VALAGLVRDRSAVAVGPTVANILPFQAGHFHRLSATAFAWIALAALAAAILAATAENSRTFLDGQDMHCSKSRAASAFARFTGYEVAFAVILAIADIIGFAVIG